MFKFAGPKLRQIRARHERQDDICGKALFKLFFYPQCVCRINKDARVLRGDHGLDYVCQVVDIGEGFNAEEDVIEGGLLACGVFGALDNCDRVSIVTAGTLDASYLIWV